MRSLSNFIGKGHQPDGICLFENQQNSRKSKMIFFFFQFRFVHFLWRMNKQFRFQIFNIYLTNYASFRYDFFLSHRAVLEIEKRDYKYGAPTVLIHFNSLDWNVFKASLSRSRLPLYHRRNRYSLLPGTVMIIILGLYRPTPRCILGPIITRKQQRRRRLTMKERIEIITPKQCRFIPTFIQYFLAVTWF